jgi:ergothioneine biosynthesis protein EgtB
MIERFLTIRKRTEGICVPLEIEDYSVQPNSDVSPPKWHLAHTTWFFEQFVLKAFVSEYSEFDVDYSYLFNSYYSNVGEHVLRADRGLMTRPTIADVVNYRNYVDEQMALFLSGNVAKGQLEKVELGINHEEQHQELLAYDMKYILGHQPTFPKYGDGFQLKKEREFGFVSVDEGVYEIGYNGPNFHFDNEENSHKVYLNAYEMSKSLVTNGNWLAFIAAGGYEDVNLWHSEGWSWVQGLEIKAPMYWYLDRGEWKYYDMTGFNLVDKDLPVMHINLYEAHAYAEWKGMRLPTEAEWEVVADQIQWGQLWEWTNSAYLPYPGFKSEAGALGEYNGKFMVNQKTLRGGSIATAIGHSRKTYRNFFHADFRLQFCGLRLVK